MIKKIYEKITTRAYIAVALFFIIPVFGVTQDWGGARPLGFWDHWTVNANVGLTSYFGDLSYQDLDIGGKLSHESGAAFSLQVKKHFSKKFGFSGQLLYGNVKGGNNKNISFETRLLEYNVQGSVEFIRLLFPDSQPKFGLEGFAGIGQLIFDATKYISNEGSSDAENHQSRVPEFVYFVGAGIHYHIAEKYALTMDLSLRQLQNDKLDNFVKNNDYDYYTYFSVGITYYIDNLLSEPLRNKARVANASVRGK